MAVKSSGTLSFDTDIVGEFKGTKPHSLSEYYAGGANVPAGTTGTGGHAIPSSGTIKFSDFYGATAQFVPPANDPAFYSGAYDVIHRPDGKYAIRLKTSGTLVLKGSTVISEYALIAGGGGGGSDYAGGGGGGGVLRGTTLTVAAGSYAVSIGGGGTGGNGGQGGSKGGDTTFNGLTAVGGGGGSGGGSAARGGSAGGWRRRSSWRTLRI